MNYLDLVFFLGRVLFGGFFILNGINHFTKHDMLAGYAASKGVPMASTAVYLTGSLLTLGGLGVLLGFYLEWALVLLVIFLVPVSFMMHAFWKVADAQAKMMDKIQFQKNMALLGAVLMLLALWK